MKKCYWNVILAVTILSISSGCQKDQLDLETRLIETMNPSVYVDPSIDLTSPQITSIIVEFKTKPARIAVLEAEAKGIPFTLEEAKKKVEESHALFREELQMVFAVNGIPYSITHTYKAALNGVSMELPANEINRMAESSSIISKIYLNRKIQLDPPISPR